MLSLKPDNGAGCRLGAKDCWERIVDSRAATPLDPPPDLPRSTADELDFLRLVARDKLKVPDAVPVPQARSISELFGVCDSAEDLQRRLAAVGDMLNGLDFLEALDEPDRVDKEGEKLKPLSALDRLLELKAPEASGSNGPAGSLRRIVAVRNTFPVHTQRGKTREAFRALGIDYPPPDEDWDGAWRHVPAELWSSFKRIREALQTAP